jgi:outer membrane lipoprotein SlyB
MKLSIRGACAVCALAFSLSASAQPSSPLRSSYGAGYGAISEFNIEQPRVYAQGERVFFTVHAAPNAREASVLISTATGPKTVPLRENDPGVYEGFYTVRRQDNFRAPRFEAKVVDRARRASSAWAAPELVDSRGGWREDRRGRDDARDARPGRDHSAQGRDAYNACLGCGRVESVRMVEEDSAEANAPGMIIGGLAGGLLGNQVGGGSGRAVATVLGALAGGAVGNEVGRNHNRRMVWIIAVRMDNGSVQNFTHPERPNVSSGQRVRVEGNQLLLDDRR